MNFVLIKEFSMNFRFIFDVFSFFFNVFLMCFRCIFYFHKFSINFEFVQYFHPCEASSGVKPTTRFDITLTVLCVCPCFLYVFYVFCAHWT